MLNKRFYAVLFFPSIFQKITYTIESTKSKKKVLLDTPSTFRKDWQTARQRPNHEYSTNPLHVLQRLRLDRAAEHSALVYIPLLVQQKHNINDAIKDLQRYWPSANDRIELSWSPVDENVTYKISAFYSIVGCLFKSSDHHCFTLSDLYRLCLETCSTLKWFADGRTAPHWRRLHKSSTRAAATAAWSCGGARRSCVRITSCSAETQRPWCNRRSAIGRQSM